MAVTAPPSAAHSSLRKFSARFCARPCRSSSAKCLRRQFTESWKIAAIPASPIPPAMSSIASRRCAAVGRNGAGPRFLAARSRVLAFFHGLSLSCSLHRQGCPRHDTLSGPGVQPVPNKKSPDDKAGGHGGGRGQTFHPPLNLRSRTFPAISIGRVRESARLLNVLRVFCFLLSR
jgi:hypothetical protein